MNTPHKFLHLIATAVLALLGACGTPVVESDSKAKATLASGLSEPSFSEATTTILLSVNLGQPNSQARALARTAVGGFDEIETLYINAQRAGGGSGYVNEQPGTQMTRTSANNNSAWSGQLDGFIVGEMYTFFASARRSDGVEIFTGQTGPQEILGTGATNNLSFNLVANLNAVEIAIPVITNITLPETVGQNNSIPVVATVQLSDNGTLDWGFKAVESSSGFVQSCNTCGSFSPASGISGPGDDNVTEITAYNYEHTISSAYMAPGEISKQSLFFQVRNSAGVGVGAQFPITITGPVDSSVTLNAQPTIMSIMAYRVQDNSSCHYCLAIQAEVKDDKPFSDLQASWSYPDSGGSHSFTSQDSVNGANSNEGAFWVIMQGYSDADASNVELTVTDQDGLTSFISLPLTPGSYPLYSGGSVVSSNGGSGPISLISTKLSSDTYYVENNEYYYFQIALNGEDTVVSLPYIPNSVSVWNQGGSVGGSFSIFNGNEYVFYNSVDGYGNWTGFDNDSIANIINQSGGSLTLKSVNGVDNSLRIVGEGQKPIIFNMNTKETSQIDNITLNYNQAIIKRPTEGSGGRDPGGNCTEFGMDGFSDQFSGHSQVSLLPDNVISGGEMDLLGFGGENSFYVCSDTPVGDYFVNFKALDGVGGLYSFTLEIQVWEEKIDGGELVLD
jgi:hypothetical protein